jgi:hypothetical protein
MKKLLKKLTLKQKIQFGAIAILSVALIVLIIVKAVIQASTLTISNTAKSSYSISGTAGSSTSNTVTTSMSSTTITSLLLTNSGLTILPSATVKYGTLMTFKYTWTGTAPPPVKLHLCRTNQFSGGSCTGGSYCDSTNYSTSSPLTCQYTPSIARTRTNPNYIYSYVCTATNVCEHNHIDKFTVTRR